MSRRFHLKRSGISSRRRLRGRAGSGAAVSGGGGEGGGERGGIERRREAAVLLPALDQPLHDVGELDEPARQIDLMRLPADAASLEQEDRRQILVAVEPRQNRRKHGDDRGPPVARVGQQVLHTRVNRAPALLEYRFEQPGLAAEGPDELRLGRARLARDRRGGCLLVAQAREERPGGRQQARPAAVDGGTGHGAPSLARCTTGIKMYYF